MFDESLFGEKYRIQSNRLPGFHYQSGWFFVTICTDNMEHFFGEIKDGEMVLNEMGKVAHQCRMDIPNHFPHVKLDEFVVMPNHVHGILMVDDGNLCHETRIGRDVAMQRLYDGGTYDGGTKKPPTKYFSKISPMTNSLGNIIKLFKGYVTKQLWHMGNKQKIRQSNYYDHIIMDDIALFHIREYIINNPKKWDEDRNNFQNLYM